ncbi:MAG TPA: exodeoxyribonuclease VII large subunit, partial [Polyangiales bacterium]|nr:exodeoxyribonuclease VII large subunit [Polyangiales bacterium]
MLRCDTLYVVTRQDSHGHSDVMSALALRAKAGGHLPATCEIESCNLHEPQTIAAALKLLTTKATGRDIVLVVRGGGAWLDHFEDTRVIEAFGMLAINCPTYVAIGHARDELPLLEDIVLESFDTPSAAIPQLDDLLQAIEASRQRRVDVEVEVVSVGATASTR